jgi:hypothetical protein
MIKTPIRLQDLRRRIYVKAKAEPTWRFWGLYVHVCKMETLQEAYQTAKSNKGAPGIDGITFDAIEESGVESFLKQIQDELVHNTRIGPCRCGRRRFRRTGALRFAFSRSLQSATAWFRVRLNTSWSRSSMLIFNRGRTAIDQNGQLMKQ